MKKFSNITNLTVGKKPVIQVKLDESSVFKSKVLNLLEQYLTVAHYGPTDRYYQAGTVKISGQELFTEALLSLLDEKTIKAQTKLLESLKSEIKDWDIIDNRIDILNSNIIGNKFKTNYKVTQLLEKYGDDDDVLLLILEEQVKKITNLETLKLYSESFGVSKLKKDTLLRISDIYKKRISQL
jgi:hypothetical protein